MITPSLDPLSPIETLEIDNGLFLSPRVKLLLNFYRADPSIKPIDDWKLKRSLIDFLASSFSPSISIPDEDLYIRRFKELKKRKRGDPVAHGTLIIRNLGFLGAPRSMIDLNVNIGDAEVLEKKLLGWKNSLVDKMDGMALNIEGVSYRLSVSVPLSDNFDEMQKELEKYYAFGGPGYAYSRRRGWQRPNTIVLRGVPSRWFAEPRVSSKPSMLVTHTIFSRFGKIRNLNVAEDDDPCENAGDPTADIVSGLQCKIIVQFEKSRDFCNALKTLSGRSLEKQGSLLKSDYEVSWDKDHFFASIGGRYVPDDSHVLGTPLVSRLRSAGRNKRFKE